MDQQTKAQLEAKGWQVGTATDFLELTTEEQLIIEIKLALAHRLEERQQQFVSETNVSSTPPNETSVNLESQNTIDQLIREMVTTGASLQEIGQLIANINLAAA